LLAHTLRTPWLWGPVLLAITTATFVANPSTNPEVSVPAGAFGAAIGLTLLVRFGLLAGVAMFFTTLGLVNMPITYDLRPWYATASVVGLAAFTLPTAFGLVISVGGWRNLVRPATAP
jgi:hypothetical protein